MVLFAPFGRIGGKRRVASLLASCIPEHRVYCEPFAGGASVFFAKERPSEVEVLNDIDFDIVTMFADIRRLKRADVDGLDLTPDPARFSGYLAKKTFTNRRDRFERNMYLSLFSFGSNRLTYCVRKTNQKHGYLLRHRFCRYKRRLRNVKLSAVDYQKVIRAYDANDAFFFVDPVFSDNNVHWYPNATVDPVRLFRLLRNMRGKFLMTVDDRPAVRELLKGTGFFVEPIERSYTLGHRRIGQKNGPVKELLVANYDFPWVRRMSQRHGVIRGPEK